MDKQYIENSVNNLKEYASNKGYFVTFESNDIGFIFKLYKVKFFGLYKKHLKTFQSYWKNNKGYYWGYTFDSAWEDVSRYIMNNR